MKKQCHRLRLDLGSPREDRATIGNPIPSDPECGLVMQTAFFSGLHLSRQIAPRLVCLLLLLGWGLILSSAGTIRAQPAVTSQNTVTSQTAVTSQNTGISQNEEAPESESPDRSPSPEKNAAEAPTDAPGQPPVTETPTVEKPAAVEKPSAEPADSEPLPGEAPTGEPQEAGEAGHPLDFPRGRLSTVRDFTTLDDPNERDAYYGLLDFARRADLKATRQRAAEVLQEAQQRFRNDPKQKNKPFSPFADLFRHPDWYRGRPITLQGYVQKLDQMDAGENEIGLKTTYQAYLFTSDSRGNPYIKGSNPYVILCTELTDGFPRPSKGNATNDVVVTGYLFKWWKYDAVEGAYAAPLIMAKKLEWRPQPPTAGQVWMGPVLAISVGVLLLGLIAGNWWRGRQDRLFRKRQRESQQIDPETLKSLSNL